MKQQAYSFKYKVSHKISHWGCLFDSLLELKYALSIQEEYSFLRAHIPIYFNPDRRPTDYIRMCTRRYTPDFLIRHKVTGKAWWVEIKPRAFAESPQLQLRREVAENYIRWKGYDWTYIVIFDDEITLSEAQLEQFAEVRKLVVKTARKIAFEKENNRFDRSMPSFFKRTPSNADIRFVMFGNK